MKLSEALQKGRSDNPQVRQCTGAYFEEDGSVVEAACAVGFIMLGSMEKGHKEVPTNQSLTKAGLEEVDKRVDCPDEDCSLTNKRVIGMILHLNDTHRYTIEQIVQYLKENKL